MSYYTQDITLLPTVESLPGAGYMYGDYNGEVIRIKVEDFINAIGGTPPIVVYGGSVPTTSTAGKVGQVLISVDLSSIYICRKAVTSGGTTTYTWEQIPTYTYITNNYRRVTIWDYATSQSNNFAVPSTRAGEIGDRIFVTTASGTGGTVWELTKTVSAYGTTSYYWGRVVHGDEIDTIKAGSLVTVTTITLEAADWSNNEQTVTLTGYTVTARTKVDIETDATVFNQLLTDNCKGLYISNNNGVLTAHALGAAPSQDLTIQITAREVTVL